MKPFLWLVVRIYLGSIFIYTGFSKLMLPMEEFRALLVQYALIPSFSVSVIALILPWIEFLTGIFLVLGYWPRISAFVSAVLCLSFVILLGSEVALKGKFPADCGCFGTGFIRLEVPHVFFMDILNFFLSLRLVFLKDHFLSLDSWLRNPKPSGPGQS